VSSIHWILEESSRDTGNWIALLLGCENPTHRDQEAGGQPDQLLQGPITEQVDALVHHMSSNSRDETEGKRRELRIPDLPTLPAPPQSADQKRQVG
jgi:hypothetical protein